MKEYTEQELTELKTRFFGQYYGTKKMYVGGVGLVVIGVGGWNLRHPDFFLQLTPLSKITDEDLQFIVVDICGVENNEFVKSKNELSIKNSIEALHDFTDTDLHVCDFLRSKGYAIPWMQFSIDELVEIGWVKLN